MADHGESAASARDVWDGLTNVERTALQVGYWRVQAAKTFRHPKTGQPLFEDAPICRVVDRCMPPEAQQEMANSDTYPIGWMAVRAAEIDRQLHAALEALPANGDSGPVQMVILGAGLDTRPWRFPWPPGTRVWEADTPSAISLRARMLGDQPLTCERRDPIACDLRQAEDLVQGLEKTGFRRDVPTIWLLEGLIGYLTADDGLSLLRTARGLSAPGSRGIMTAPPTQAHKEDMESKGLKLHHSTFEEVDATAARIKLAGWQVQHLVTSAEQEERYGVADSQQILIMSA